MSSLGERQASGLRYILLGVLTLMVLILGLGFSYAYAFLAPYGGVDYNSDWYVVRPTNCAEDPAWCEANPGELLQGDRLLQIGSLTLQEYEDDPLTLPFDGYSAGELVPIELDRGGEFRRTEWLMPTPRVSTQLLNFLVISIPFFPFWVAALLVYAIIRPRDRRWGLLALFFLVIALWVSIGSVSISGVAWSGLLLAMIGWVLLPVFVHTHFEIPTQVPGLVPRIGLYFVYGLGTIGAVLTLFRALQASAWYMAVFAGIFVALVALLARSFFARSPADRTTTRLMLFGVGMAFLPSFIVFFIPALLEVELPSRWPTAVALLALPVLPLTYIYAVFKRQFGDLEFRANRLLGLYMFVLAYASLFALVFILVASFIRTREGELFTALGVSIVFIAAAPAAQARFQRWFEQLAYGSTYDPDEILTSFSENLPAASSPQELVSLLSEEVEPSLLIRQSAIFQFDGTANLLYARGLDPDKTRLARENLEALLVRPGHYRRPDEPPVEGAWVRLALPLETSERRVGAWLFGERDPDDHYSRKDIDLLKALSRQVALALENVRLISASQRQMRELEGLYDVAVASTSDLDVERLTLEVYRQVSRLIQLDAFAVTLMVPETDVYEIVLGVEAGKRLDHLTGMRIKMADGGLTATVLRSGETVWENNVQPQMVGAGPHPESEGRIRSWLGVPLLARDRLIGTISAHAFRQDAFTETDKRYLETLSRQLGTAMANAQLFEETRQRATQQEAVNTVIAAATGATELPDLLELGIQQSMRALNSPSGVVWTDEPFHARSAGVPAEFRPLAARMVREALARPRPVLAIEDLRRPRETLADTTLATEVLSLDIQACLVVPLFSEARAIGGLALASGESRAWTSDDLGIAEAIGQQLGGAVERLRLLDKIQDNARQMERILDSVDEGIFTIDAQHRVVLANPAARDYLRALSDVTVGERIFRLGGHAIEELLEYRPGSLPHTIRLGEPSNQVFETVATPFTVVGERLGWTMVLRNVTEVHQVQQMVQQQDRLAAVGQLAAGIAHDFNNIMAAIILYSEMLISQPDLESRSRERLGTILQQAQRASDLTRQVLDFSRRSVMEQHPTSLVPFLKELQKLLARTMPENINISLDYEDEDAIANADPSRMQQVFMNLALNARDAMPQGGELNFGLNLLELGEGQAPPSPGMSLGRWICIQVSDTGCGIAPEALPHIFEPFFTTKEVGSGTGLGLAQVYGIVQQHNGHILVRSEVGRGTKFSIFLPALFAPTTLLSGGRPEPVERGHQQSILVVEDDGATREGVREVLESLNYRVQVATDGKEALSIYGRQGGFDLVITDLVMPGLGGMALYKTLRETEPGVRVIIMTGYPLGHGTRELLEDGHIFWIQKPLNTVMLAGAIRQVLQSDPEAETGITSV